LECSKYSEHGNRLTALQTQIHCSIQSDGRLPSLWCGRTVSIRVARNADGTIGGVGMPIRWRKRSARIMVTGTDGETVPAAAPLDPKAEQPADTPTATGNPPTEELSAPSQAPTSEPDGTGSS